MDAFYASVEQRDHPELRGRPVIVGGVGSRGVVSAASYEARRFGVRSAMPAAQARALCPDGVFLRGDLARYVRESRRIFELFRAVAPLVEGLSIDEAFLDLSGTRRLLGPSAAVAQRLRARMRAETGLAVSVGIAPVKMVAKIASSLAKPDGLLEVPADGVRAFLDPLPVSRLWGVGPVAEARLRRAGFERIGQLAHADVRQIESLLGDWGRRVVHLARGEDLRDVEPFHDAASYSEENTFAEDVSQRARLDQTILAHADSVARRLRRDGVRARTVVLKLKLGRRVARGRQGYPLLTRRETLARPSDDGAELARVARRLLDRADLHEPVRLVGVGATGIVRAEDAEREQLALFAAEGDAQQTERRRRLNRALDTIHDRFGRAALQRAHEPRVERAGLSQQVKRGEDDA